MINEDKDARLSAAIGDCGSIEDCEEAIRQLYAFMDNELTAELRVAFETHLNLCGECGEIVSFESELRKVIANRCQDRVPDELISRIAAAISRESEKHA
jgi:anti-sigma factor (TIGR02949 family)